MFYAGVPLWVVILSGVAYVIGMGGAIYFGIGVATMLRPRVTARIANTAGIEDARQIDQADPISLRELGRRRIVRGAVLIGVCIVLHGIATVGYYAS